MRRGLVSAIGFVAAAASALPAAAQPAPASGQRSFCTDDEITVFTCPTASRIVSVCAPKGTSPAAGWLEYRLGKADAARPELVEPAVRVAAAQAAVGGTVAFSGGGGAWLRFTVGDIRSTVYTAIGRFGPNGETVERAGMVAHRAGKEIASLKCTGRPVSLLGPDWFERAGVTSGGQDFDLPD